MIDLGFAEECEKWLLKNTFFPSKIGGYPSWLELKNLPDQHELLCELCNEPCAFLCQVYAPSELDPVKGFHRTIFLFICKNAKCCMENSSKNLIAFRSQLPRKNDYYSFEPPVESQSTLETKVPVNLCRVCGCRGPLFCGKCKSTAYCGQLHQKIDWRSNHKENCGKSNAADTYNEFLFPEYEIVIEREVLQKSTKESEKEAEKRRLKEYEELKKSGKIGEMSEISEKDLDEFAESKEDKTFGKFKKTIDSNPEQVLRYHRNGQALWISKLNIPEPSDIPKCSSCNGPRTFEFQVMPQMLNYLKNYDLDWGVITVYTCKNDCDVKSKYIREFVYKQDIVKTDDDESEIDIEKLKSQTAAGPSKSVEDSKSNGSMDVDPVTVSAPVIPNKSSQKKEKPKEKSLFADNDDWD